MGQDCYLLEIDIGSFNLQNLCLKSIYCICIDQIQLGSSLELVCSQTTEKIWV